MKTLTAMHVRDACLAVLILALTNGTAYSDERFDASEALSHRLAAYSRAASLAPLGSHGPELRVWVDGVMFGKIRGFVISRNGVIECETSWDIDGSVVTVKSVRCKPRTVSDRARRALSLLPELSNLNGKELDCGVEDGSDVFLEGWNSLGSFVLFAGNPSSCRDPGSVLVTRLLKILGT